MSSMVSGLSEDSAGFPIIGSDLSEYSPNLPQRIIEEFLVNSANVGGFWRGMVGNRGETWESTLQTSVKWLEKRAVARRYCTFVEERLSQHPCSAFVKPGQAHWLIFPTRKPGRGLKQHPNSRFLSRLGE